MKKMMMLMMLSASLTITTACSSEDPFDSYTFGGGTIGGGTTTGGGTVSTGSGELTSFAVEIDKTTAEPADVASEYFPDEEDNLDNNSFTTEVNITFNGSSVAYDTVDGVKMTADGAHLTVDHGSTKGICYVVSGSTSAGSLTVVGDKKYALKLNGADITTPDSAAINLLSKKRAYVVLAAGTTNKVTDGTSSKADDQKAAFYCKGKLLFNGTGSLEVYGNYKNAIHSADYIVFRQGSNIYAKSTKNHGIKANDGIYINGGILNVEVTAEAAKGINCESHIMVNGGRTTVITTGNGAYDSDEKEAKGAACIKADSTFTINGGELWLKSTGSGGKGIKADQEAYFNGGSVYVITTGSQYSKNNDTASPKGIKVDSDLYIDGGTIMVRTSGKNGEGIESKKTLTVTDGNIQVSAYDDAINSSGDMYIKGGTITAVGTNNDGLDSNGNMYISGGTVVAFGASGAETGIDIDEQHKLYITGGSVFGIGGRIDASFGSTSSSQAFAVTTGSTSANGTVTVSSGTTTLATFAMPPYTYTNGTILVSAPGMSNGSSYTLTLGSNSQTVTATLTYSGGGMGGGGGRPGGF